MADTLRQHSLLDPIPNYTDLRRGKAGYDTRYAIDTEHPLHNDPLVDPRDPEFGFADASSYYAKPNTMTGEKLPGVPDAPLLRLDIVKRLMQAEQFLRTDTDVREALGTPVRLKIDDALRPFQVQQFAYNVAWPMIIKSENPELTEVEVREQLSNYCAKPAAKPTPTPHATGGAADVALISMESGEAIDRGHKPGKVHGTAYPDFHEGYHLEPGKSDIEQSERQTEVEAREGVVVLGRRILHYAMTTVAGLYVNPQEIWHYGKGDPLSEYVSGSGRPYYGIAELPEWYTTDMQRMQAG